jgi:pyrimidine operon attenuation protein/uracil phosphoribosyltransferase
MTAEDVSRAVRRIAHEVIEGSPGVLPVLVGIHTRGVPLAGRIADTIRGFGGSEVPVGALDIGLHRDDLARRPTAPLAATRLPVNITDRTVVLVDDVLFTGRTVRAALDALNDFGRPSVVRLAVLVDRGHRQLPIRPDHVGKNVPTSRIERVSVRLYEIDGEGDGVWIHPRRESPDRRRQDIDVKEITA